MTKEIYNKLRQMGEIMFDNNEKREIAKRIQDILIETKNPFLPTKRDIKFTLSIHGKGKWHCANIYDNTTAMDLELSLNNEA